MPGVMSETDASPKKTSRETPLRTPATGRGKLRVGNPGNKGGGRPRDEWKERLRAIVSADGVLDALAEVLADPGHPAYVGALKYATDHGYGKATETVVHTGEDGGPIQHQVWMFGKRKVAF